MKYFLNHRLKEFPKLTKIHKNVKNESLKIIIKNDYDTISPTAFQKSPQSFQIIIRLQKNHTVTLHAENFMIPLKTINFRKILNKNK
jgi:hypothetical protein